MTAIREFAPAKVNLTLSVSGRHANGYHALASLVAFADVGDSLVLEPCKAPAVSVRGPFAAALAGAPNLLDHVLALAAREVPGARLGAVWLEKTLPVAAGLGGGSADAAALLRAIRMASLPVSEPIDWRGLAIQIGADVPACLESRALWMTGIGETLSDVAGGVPELAALLVNPLVEVPADKTARVFRVLDAPPLASGWCAEPAPSFRDRAALIAFLTARGNDLEAAACAVVPAARDVLDALRADDQAEHVGVSGAGPTCFAVFADRAAAEAARNRIRATHPEWWAEAVTLR